MSAFIPGICFSLGPCDAPHLLMDNAPPFRHRAPWSGDGPKS